MTADPTQDEDWAAWDPDLSARIDAEESTAAEIVSLGPDEPAELEHDLPRGNHSSQPPAGMSGTKDEWLWRSPRELVTDAAAAIEWAAAHYAAFGTVVEVISSPKAGKTTLLLDLVAAILGNRPWLGRATAYSPVAILTEQLAPSYRQALVRAGLEERDDIRILLWRDARGRSWPDIVQAAVDECRRIGARVLIIDTLPSWAGVKGDAENDAGRALEVMEPVQLAAAEGLLVIVVRHLRKGGALELADAGRGSSALSASVDVILRLSRKDGGSRPTIRVLHALSRFDETPAELVIEFVDGRYEVLGDQFDVEMNEARAAILEQLATEGAETTLTELVKATSSSRTTLDRALKAMVDDQTLAVEGRGVRGDPRRFRQAIRDSVSGGDPLRGSSPARDETQSRGSVSERMAELFDIDLDLDPETQAKLDGALGGATYPAAGLPS